MTVRFQKDMLLFEEDNTSAKPGVSPLDWRLPTTFRDFVWWNIKIF